MKVRRFLVTSALTLSLLVSACGGSEIQASSSYKLIPTIQSICDSSTGFVNFELTFLQDGMYLINETPYSAEKSGDDYVFPEESWITYENTGIVWEIYYLNAGIGEHESYSGLIGYENTFILSNPNGVEYTFAIDQYGAAGLVRENGKCLESGNAQKINQN